MLGNIVHGVVFDFTYNPSSVSTITTAEDTVTVYGLRVGDFVMVNKPSHETGIGIVNARVSADNTLAITLMNPTAGSVDEASETWYGIVFRPEIPHRSNAVN